MKTSMYVNRKKPTTEVLKNLYIKNVVLVRGVPVAINIVYERNITI